MSFNFSDGGKEVIGLFRCLWRWSADAVFWLFVGFLLALMIPFAMGDRYNAPGGGVSPPLFIETNRVVVGEDGQDGQVDLYSEQGVTDRVLSILTHTNMTENYTIRWPPSKGIGGHVMEVEKVVGNEVFIEFDTDDTAAGGSSEFTDTGSDLHPNEPAVDNLLIGGTNTTLAVSVLYANGNSVFNNLATNADMTVKGQGVNPLFKVDGGLNKVGVKVGIPSYDLHVDGHVALASNIYLGGINEASAQFKFKDSVLYMQSNIVDLVSQAGAWTLGTNGVLAFKGLGSVGITNALDNVQSGEIVYLGAGTFSLPASYSLTPPPNVRVIGSGMPTYDAGTTNLVGGTILDGNITISYATNSFFADFGVMNQVTGTTKTLQFNMTPTGIANIRLQNISVLHTKSDSGSHGLIIEGSRWALNHIEAYGSDHPIVIKAAHVRGQDILTAHGNISGIIIKADGESADPVKHVQLSDIDIRSYNGVVSRGILIESLVTRTLEYVDIRGVQAYDGVSKAIYIKGAGEPKYINIVDVFIEGGTNEVVRLETGSYVNLVNILSKDSKGPLEDFIVNNSADNVVLLNCTSINPANASYSKGGTADVVYEDIDRTFYFDGVLSLSTNNPPQFELPNADGFKVKAGSGSTGGIPSDTTFFFPFIQQKDFTLIEPDKIQVVEDHVRVMCVESYNFPVGIKIVAIRLDSSAAVTTTVNFEEWDQAAISGATISTIDAVTLTAASEVTETTITDSDIATGSYIMADLDTTDINQLGGTIWFYAK